jgi:hypothetical protein
MLATFMLDRKNPPDRPQMQVRADGNVDSLYPIIFMLKEHLIGDNVDSLITNNFEH